MSHVKFAISPARRPAFADSKTMTRLRIGWRVQLAKVRRSAISSWESILACLASIGEATNIEYVIMNQVMISRNVTIKKINVSL